MFLNRLILQYQAWICRQTLVQAQVTLLPDWTCHFHASVPPMNEDECFICSADRVDMWTTYQEEADEDCGRDPGHSGVPPLGRRHILAQQVQGEGVPLWGESDFTLLGSHSSPLLSWRVGTHTTYWIQRGWDLILDPSQGCIGTEQYSWSISVLPALPLSETSKASKISCTFGWSRTPHTSIHFYLCGDFKRSNPINPNHPS